MRISFYPFLNNLGHILPSLALAEQMRERGHRVCFRGEGIFESTVREAGFPLEPVFTFSDEYDRKSERWMSQWTEEVTGSAIASELESISEDRPDVVVGDFRPTLGISARCSGVPLVFLLCADWTNFYDYPAAIVEVERHLGPTWGRRLGWIAAPARRVFLSRAARHLRAAYRRFGVPLPGRGNLFDAWTGDLNLIQDVPEFAPLRPEAPGSFHFVGPVLRSLPASDPTALARLDPERPLIYLTLGSSGVLRGEGSVAWVAEALGNRREQVFLTTGGQCPIPEDLPENMIVTEIDDGLQLTQRASLTICKGGTGTVYQSLHAGTPLFCIPRNHNQYYVSKRVEAAGVGRMDCEGHSPKAFARIAEEVMGNPEFRARARALGESVRKHVEQRRAVRLIEDLVARN